MMNNEDKHKFDYLNDTSYLLRLNLERNKFDIVRTTILNDDIWTVTYSENVVGTITFRQTPEHTFCNIRFYTYIKDQIKINDFLMSEFFQFDDDGKWIRFNFEKFDKFFEPIKQHIKYVEAEPEVEQQKLEDCVSRLREYCDVDEKFSKNLLTKDLKVLLKDYDRMKQELKSYSNKIVDLFLKMR